MKKQIFYTVILSIFVVLAHFGAVLAEDTDDINIHKDQNYAEEYETTLFSKYDVNLFEDSVEMPTITFLTKGGNNIDTYSAEPGTPLTLPIP